MTTRSLAAALGALLLTAAFGGPAYAVQTDPSPASLYVPWEPSSSFDCAIVKTKGQVSAYDLGQTFTQYGDDCMRAGKYGVAAAYYGEGLDALSANPEVGYYARGMAYFYAGEYTLAVTDLTRAIKLVPEARDYYHRAAAYLNEKKYGPAISDLTQAIGMAPDVPDGYFLRGAIYSQQGNYDLAVADETKVLVLDMTNSDAYAQRGFAYEKMDQKAKALADYHNALSLDPQCQLALDGLKRLKAA